MSIWCVHAVVKAVMLYAKLARNRGLLGDNHMAKSRKVTALWIFKGLCAIIEGWSGPE